jgi:hypothetical protein
MGVYHIQGWVCENAHRGTFSHPFHLTACYSVLSW